MVATFAHTLWQGLCPTRLSHPSVATGPTPRSGDPHTQQISVAPGDIVQLDADDHRLRVLSGRIWVAQAGRERILYAGEELWVGRNQWPIMLWTLMRQPARVAWRKL